MIQSQSYVIHFPESYGKDCLVFLRKEREMGRRAKLYQEIRSLRAQMGQNQRKMCGPNQGATSEF